MEGVPNYRIPPAKNFLGVRRDRQTAYLDCYLADLGRKIDRFRCGYAVDCTGRATCRIALKIGGGSKLLFSSDHFFGGVRRGRQTAYLNGYLAGKSTDVAVGLFRPGEPWGVPESL